jgi:hypothetical protein
MLTSDIRNAQHSYASLLDHAALVREQRDSARRGARVAARSTAIGEIVARNDARLVGSLLWRVSMYTYIEKVVCGSRVAG